MHTDFKFDIKSTPRTKTFKDCISHEQPKYSIIEEILHKTNINMSILTNAFWVGKKLPEI